MKRATVDREGDDHSPAPTLYLPCTDYFTNADGSNNPVSRGALPAGSWENVRAHLIPGPPHLCENTKVISKVPHEPEVSGFQLTKDAQMELYRQEEEEFHAFFTTGPVVAFQVDDVDSARTTIETAGIEFIGPIQRAGKTSWNHFRAPDGTVFEILSRADDER